MSHELPGRFTAGGTDLPRREMEQVVAAQAKLPGEMRRGGDEQSWHSICCRRVYPQRGCLSSLPTLCWGHGVVLDVTSLLSLLQPHQLSLGPG